MFSVVDMAAVARLGSLDDATCEFGGDEYICDDIIALDAEYEDEGKYKL